MELLLTIQGGDISEQEAYSHRFDETGGTIGRSPRNDWMLFDPDRYISERHARIHFHNGRFLLTDLSTNGTYLNGDRRRIPRHESVTLNSGDYLSIGNLQMEVILLGPGAYARETPAGAKAGRVSSRSATIPRNPSVAPEFSSGGRAQANAAHGHAGHPASPGVPEEWQDLIAGFFATGADRSGDGERPARSSHGSRPAPEGDPTIAALFRELGIQDISGRVDPETFGRDVGRILRMVTEGLMTALRTRTEIKERFRIEQTHMRAAGNNPLKASDNPETALRRLLHDDEDGTYLQGVPAFREALDDLRTHEVAILAAVHASIEGVIAGFDPGPLKNKLRHIAPVSAATPVLNSAKCWRLYEDYYQEVAARLRDDARLGFLKEFAHAYETAVERLRDESDSDQADD